MRRWPRTAPTAAGPQPSPLQNAVDLLALTAPLSRPPDQLICRNAPVGHHSEDLVPASVGQLHRGERELHLSLHSRQRLFDQPLPGSYEPILRAVLGVPYPVGHEVHISPLLTRVHTMLPNLAVQHLPVLLGDLGQHSAQPSRRPQPQTRSPRTARLYPPRSTEQLPLVPRRVRPQHHLLHPRRQTAQRFNQHSQLLMAQVRCRPETPNARSTRPLTSR